MKKMVKYVDWLNIMTYDIHGTWDGHNEWTQQVINPHTNLTGKLKLIYIHSIPLIYVKPRANIQQKYHQVWTFSGGTLFQLKRRSWAWAFMADLSP